MNAQLAHDIRGVLIGVTGGRLLLPNALIAEVITFSEPAPVADAPAWLLGRSRWHGWQLPIISFSRMAGWADAESELGAKVAVIKATGGHAGMPYFAVLTQGFPRLVTVSPAALQESGVQRKRAPGVHANVLFNDDDAVVPDLPEIEQKLANALASAPKN